ncbi:AMP-binding protein [Nocardioides acrostichi]|uniref:AMP-binding protein n=1 Tax=Nocardioides acrostichi TaxID=2784339 RepID=UPI001A9CB56A|nr:AMP-binding protein [Nocardioides acrostichi]
MLWRSGMIGPLSPLALARMAAVLRRGVSPTSGFALAAAKHPHAVALVDERGPLTWRELDESADACAAGLLALSGGTPATIAVLARNHRGFVQTLAGGARTGGDVLLLNTSFSAPQLRDVLRREGASVIVHDAEFAAVVDEATADLPDLGRVIAWADEPTPGVETLDALLRAHHGRRPPSPERRSAVILLTSGTTGTPKGAKRSTGSGGTLAAMLDRIPWRAGETVVVAAPMFHAFGFGQLLIAAAMGCPVVTRRRFDPEATLAMVDGHGATGLAVVPVMIERITDLPAETLDRYPCASLRFVTASGSRMRPDAVVAFMDRFGETIYNSYNATEAGLISTATPADLRHAPDTAGQPLAGTELAILDDDWHPVPTGQVGRICVRSGTAFEGYTSGETKEHTAHAGEEWMVSGDVGRLDDGGRLFVVGRDDDMIVSGGENVYPIEVEKILGAHDAVREVVVVGVDDEQFGQRLAAYVVPTPDAPDPAALTVVLKEHVKAQLAGYKVPRDVVLLDELPRNASGKVVVRSLPAAGSAHSEG